MRAALMYPWPRTGGNHFGDRPAFHVATTEIEAVPIGHPDVLDCPVFGVPDERPGELNRS